MTVLAGAAVVDITPPPGLMMCGYAARTEPATGTHDPLTARALVIGDTAIVVADVLGIHEDSCARIRAASGFADDRVVVIATHTHGGPMPMPDRGGGSADPAFLKQLEEECAAAIRQAVLDSHQRNSVTYLYAEPGGEAQHLYHQLGFRTVVQNAMRSFLWQAEP